MVEITRLSLEVVVIVVERAKEFSLIRLVELVTLAHFLPFKKTSFSLKSNLVKGVWEGSLVEMGNIISKIRTS
jgi:hypothetical protein